MTEKLPSDPNAGAIQAPIWDWDNGEKVAYTDTAAQSAAINVNVVMLCANTNCFIKFGSNPTAADSSGSFPLYAGVTVTLGFVSGEKISVVRKDTSGSLYILPRK